MKAKIEVVVHCPADMGSVTLEDCEACEYHAGQDLVKVICEYGE